MFEILNLGCGTNLMKSNNNTHILNIDALKQKEVKDTYYIRHDIMKFPYPIQTGWFDKCYFFHIIEHIKKPYHKPILSEIRRVLKPDGLLYISYPEFTKIAKCYIDNKGGNREFWEKTIYGRQTTKWDHHVSLMNTIEFVKTLREVGLEPIKVNPEKTQPFNTAIIAKRGEPMVSYENLLGLEFGATERNT